MSMLFDLLCNPLTKTNTFLEKMLVNHFKKYNIQSTAEFIQSAIQNQNLYVMKTVKTCCACQDLQGLARDQYQDYALQQLTQDKLQETPQQHKWVFQVQVDSQT